VPQDKRWRSTGQAGELRPPGTAVATHLPADCPKADEDQGPARGFRYGGRVDRRDNDYVLSVRALALEMVGEGTSLRTSAQDIEQEAEVIKRLAYQGAIKEWIVNDQIVSVERCERDHRCVVGRDSQSKVESVQRVNVCRVVEIQRECAWREDSSWVARKRVASGGNRRLRWGS